MVDGSPPKLMHKLWRDALCFHVSVDGYLWLGFNNVEVAYLFTWRLFSIPVLHLTWLDETVLSCVKCIINFSGMLCILENVALQNIAKWCISVYWHVCRWYDCTGFTWKLFPTPMLHLTWLDETMPSCVKCIIHFSRMLCILENSALHKGAYLCIDVHLGDMTAQGSTQCTIHWATHAALQTLV